MTGRDPYERFGRGGSSYRGSCPHFWSSIQKYGWDNFSHDIVASGLTKEAACDMEIQLIKDLKTQDREYGYNVMPGGECPAMPDEVKRKLSNALMGNKNGLGHPCTEGKKKKISDAQKGRRFTAEHRAAISAAKLGVPHESPSDETKKKISDSHKKKPVYCVDLDIVYPSIQECARQLGIGATTVCACCKGRVRSAGGHRFEYATLDYHTINA